MKTYDMTFGKRQKTESNKVETELNSKRTSKRKSIDLK